MGKCLRKAFAWNAKFGSSSQQVGQQYIELPRAISDPNGNLHKGQKSYTTKWLENRYKDLVCNQLLGGWVPDVVVLEGMFTINTSPLTTHSTMKDYSQFLLCRFVLHHLTNGCSEVHVVFDNPGRQPNSPKSFERKRRDDTASLSTDHKHLTFRDACPIPSKWRDCLAGRECKRALVLYLGQSFKQFAVGTCRLREHQKVILAGCFSGVEEDQAWEVSTGGVQPVPTLSCGAEEADTRVWLHVLRSPGTRKLVCSPDTDVYHIGLPLICNQPLDVFVRISMFSSQEHRYLSLKNLTTSLQGDPDLSSVPRDLLPKMLQTLFICTGCDYVSYFAGFGKSTFLKVFFQHASFNNDVSQGTLASTCDTTRQLGFLSFVRLIGTVYFKKHLSTFKYDCPRALLNSSNSDPISQHKQWLDCIRSTVWENIEFEDELPPSWEALGGTGSAHAGYQTFGVKHATAHTTS